MALTQLIICPRRILAVLVVSVFGSASQTDARGEDSSRSLHGRIEVPNSNLMHSGDAEQRVRDWKFEAVELIYGETMGLVQPRIRTKGNAIHRLPLNGRGVIMDGKTDTARGDLISLPLEIDAFRQLRVTVEYVVESGEPLVLVSLRPTNDRSLVDTSFLPVLIGERRQETVLLNTGRREGAYSLSLSLVGIGSVRFMSVSIERGEKLVPPNRAVVVVDLMHPKPLASGPYGWDNIRKLVDVFGFSRIEFIHPLEVTRERLDKIAPALIVLSPTSEEMLRTDPNEIGIDTYLGGVRRAAEYGVPVVGICAGHHILAMAHGGRAGAVVEQGPDGLRELFEWGPTELTATKKDSAFDGLPRFPRFRIVEAHSRVVHSSFTMAENLASSETCALQVFHYPDRPWYTFQGHIESDWEYSCPEAYLIWKNLLRKWDLGMRLQNG